jgi:hypothetical protein
MAGVPRSIEQNKRTQNWNLIHGIPNMTQRRKKGMEQLGECPVEDGRQEAGRIFLF